MHRVGSLNELRHAKRLCADVDGKRVAVFLVDGKVIATTGRCPHAGGPLADGELCGAILTCPWHGWTYNLDTGSCEEDPDISLPFYDVRIDGDDVYVTV